jgi:hypothetical protein
MKKKIRTTEEQINSVKFYALKLGAIFSGEISGVGNKRRFKLVKEKKIRWSSLSSLDAGSNPFSKPTIDELIERVVICSNRIGCDFNGEYDKGQPRKFKLVQNEKIRWISLQDLERGRNPFARPKLEEMENEIRYLAKKINAVYTGNIEQRGQKKEKYFELIQGHKARWVRPAGLRKGSNPFQVPTENETLAEVKSYEEKLGAVFTGEIKKTPNQKTFCFVKNGSTKWIPLCSLRAGVNSFSVPTLDELKVEAKSFDEDINATFTGETNGKGSTLKFQFIHNNDNRERWVRIGELRRGNNPFNKQTLDEMIVEVKGYEKTLNVIYIGVEKKKANTNRKYIFKKGDRTASITLSDLKYGHNPFNRPTIKEQLDIVSIAAKAMKLGATLRYEQQEEKPTKFEVTDGKYFVWSTLGHLQSGRNPINKLISVQKDKAQEAAKKIGIIFTGKHKSVPRKNVKSKYNVFEVTNGVDSVYTPLSHLERGNNPWNDQSGFQKNKPAILYYLLIKNEYFKIGVTNRTVEERFGDDMKYIQVLSIWNYESGLDAYNKEQELLKTHKEHRYIGEPLLLSGNTEIFTKNILKIYR